MAIDRSLSSTGSARPKSYCARYFRQFETRNEYRTLGYSARLAQAISPGFRRGSRHERRHQCPDILVPRGPVWQMHLAVHLVDVSASHPGAREIARFDEIGNDPLDCALGDPHLVRDITKPYLRVLRDRQQDQPVGRDEGPRHLGRVGGATLSGDGRNDNRRRNGQGRIPWIARLMGLSRARPPPRALRQGWPSEIARREGARSSGWWPGPPPRRSCMSPE